MGIKLKRDEHPVHDLREGRPRSAEVCGTTVTRVAALCDIASHLYRLVRNPAPNGSRTYEDGPPQIRALHRSTALVSMASSRHVLFGAAIAGADFDKQTGRWRIPHPACRRKARSCPVPGRPDNGQLSLPRRPKVPVWRASEGGIPPPPAGTTPTS